MIDTQRLIRKLGTLSSSYLLILKEALEYTLQLDQYEDKEQSQLWSYSLKLNFFMRRERLIKRVSRLVMEELT
ncbi:MAG: hypothetical protein ACKPH7_09535 [Planktothrix sp.]|uniref:hypothetical protein n=1 Tax=Planktothrix sp. TaxID=3088171 RepID=UPI0038D402F8